MNNEDGTLRDAQNKALDAIQNHFNSEASTFLQQLEDLELNPNPHSNKDTSLDYLAETIDEEIQIFQLSS